MTEPFQYAANLHFMYRASADNNAQVLSDLMTTYPLKSFPKQSARVWRAGMLAEIWGVIATELCGHQVDYIENWRTGK